jgi:hypothetical protein
MMNRRRKRKSAGGGSDRKHLTGLEVERLIAATKGSRNEARDRCLLLLMFQPSESLEPPLNRRRGDNFSAAEYIQALDPG